MHQEKDPYKKIYNKFKRKLKFEKFMSGKRGFMINVLIGSTSGAIIGAFFPDIWFLAGVVLISAFLLIHTIRFKGLNKRYEFEKHEKLAAVSEHQPIVTDYFPFVYLTQKYLKRVDTGFYGNIITSYFQEKNLALSKENYIKLMKLIFSDPEVEQVYQRCFPNSKPVKDIQYQNLLDHLPTGNIIRWNTFYGWCDSPICSTTPQVYRTDDFIAYKNTYHQAWDTLRKYSKSGPLTTDEAQQLHEARKTIDQWMNDYNPDSLFLLNIESEDKKNSKLFDLSIEERFEMYETEAYSNYRETFFSPSIRAREIVKTFISEMSNPVNAFYPATGEPNYIRDLISNEDYIKLAD